MMKKITNKKKMLGAEKFALSTLLVVAVSLLAGSIYASIDSDRDSVPDPIDQCVDTVHKKFRDGLVRENGCVDMDGDHRFPGLAENHPQYDANDGNGCLPDRSSPACKTNDTDGDGIVNREDPHPKNPCRPNANTSACREEQRKKENGTSSDQLFEETYDYINPYQAQKYNTQSIRRTKIIRKENPTGGEIETQTTVEKISESKKMIITNQKAVGIIMLFNSYQHGAPSLQASENSLLKGMSIDQAVEGFTYYNTIVALLNILEKNEMISDWENKHTINLKLQSVEVTEADFIRIMSKLSSLIASNRG